MKISVRLIALALTAALGIGLLVSCGPKNGENDANTGSNTNQTVNTETGDNTENGNDSSNDGKTDGEASLELPEGKFLEGETFNLYHAHNGFDSYYVEDVQSGDLKGESVMKRNAAVEERTGVKLNFVHTTTPADQGAETQKISSLILAGDTTYDAYVHVQHTGMPGLINEGMFIDWYKLPYINFDKPWWYSNTIRDINFGGKVFAMTGDYNLNSFSCTNCLAFNKTMLDELEMPYPYQDVFDGTWTKDRFIEYIVAATKDLNGDGHMDYDNDRYGFGGWQWEQTPAMYVGFGGQTLVKDDNGLPKLNIYSRQQNEVIDAMIEVYNQPGAFHEGKTWGVDDGMFNEGRLLFNDSMLHMIVGMRNLEDDIGFVPYPKLNEEQTEYYSRTGNTSCLTYIPVTLTEDRYDIVGGTLEAMAYYSNQIVLPTYFDTILTVQSTRDVESEQMIPIIKGSSRFMDQAIGFSPASIVYSGQNTLASHYAANKTGYEEKLATLIKVYE